MSFTSNHDEMSYIHTEYDNDCEVTIETTTASSDDVVINDNIIYDTSTDTGLPITEQEFILLANVVSHEAGSSWITEYDRACIVAAIMNRVADSRC